MVKNCIAANINFLDIFTYSNVKMTQVETEAARLSGFKKQIEDNLEHLVGDYSEHPSVALTLFVFYKHIEMYRSRESEFKKLAGQAGLQPRSPRCRPRIHDVRHSVAVRALVDCYATGGDALTLLPLLSTFMGHTDPKSTYWYLSAAPELMALTSRRLEDAFEVNR